MYAILMLLIGDYISTFIGIKMKLIEEANPLMKWIFMIGFSKGIIIRVIISIALLVPFYICKKRNIIFYKRSVMLVLIMYAPVIALHIAWIIKAVI